MFCFISALSIVSRLDPDPSNRGTRKCTVTIEEIRRRISPPENMGMSVNTLKALFRVQKTSKYDVHIDDIVKKVGGTDQEQSSTLSYFSLLLEGKSSSVKVVFL